MIQTMFLGRVDYERLERKGQLPEVVERTVAAVREVLEASRSEAAALACAGFSGFGDVAPLRDRCLPGYWIASGDVRAARARDVLARIGEAVRPISVGRSDKDLRIADYAAVRQVGYPAYLGGPYTYAASKIA